MGSHLSLQRSGRPVERRSGAAARGLAVVLLAASLLASGVPAAAEEALSPVELGETPLFERPSPLGSISYTAGRGLRVGDTGLTLGGYANLTVGRPEGGPGELELQDVSLFAIWDPLPRLHFFSEIEWADVFEANDKGDAGSPDERLTVERLYADVTVNDLVNVRTGIFLTPVGRWNVIHAPPLHWTTEQPLVTELPFDPNTTGVMLFGSVFPERGVLRYSVWDQLADPVEGDPEFDPADHSVGARLEYTDDLGWSIGATYLAARREGDWRHLGGADLLWHLGRLELMGELAVEDGAGDEQWGAYLQSVFQLTSRTYLVGRFEHYDFADPEDGRVNLITLGVAFRPLPAVVLKAEYLIADRSAPEAEAGIHASFATLF